MDIDKLIASNGLPMLDVRSEGEYAQGHIPGAMNEPLLNNEERKQVGICYKQKGKEEAIHLGYELVGSQFSQKLRNVRVNIEGNKAIVYCWRGGLRSKIFSQILENGGFVIERLKDGYKSFRKWALTQLDRTYPIVILGGATGSGKTELLHLLKERGEQVIDLEGLTNHKGSTYGGIGMEPQPSNEQFENDLAMQLHHFTTDKPVWVENESRSLGRVKIPDAFFEQMRTAKVIKVELPLQFRIKRILQEYAVLPKDQLIIATEKLEKRLGNLNMKLAIEHISKGEFEEWISLMLKYYDKTYAHGNSLRKQEDIFPVHVSKDDPIKTTELILKCYHDHIIKNRKDSLNAV